jgi:PAS domain S-box-containing protein
MLESHANELIAYLRKEGVPESSVTLVPHTFDPMDLINGKVDAMSAYVTDEPFFLAQNHHSSLEFTPRMGGIDFYGDNLFTSEAELKAHPLRVKAFREASLKGWKYAMQHPDAVIDLIQARYGPRRGRAYLSYEAQKMVPLIQPVLVDMGYMYNGRWQHIADTYTELGLLPKGFPLEGFLYDPEVGARQDYRRLTRALAALLALGGILGGAVLVFIRLNLKLRKEIASRERAEEAIRLEHEMTERYLRVAEVILLARDPRGRIIMLNRKGHAVLGHPEGALVGQDWFERCVPEEGLEIARAAFQRVLGGLQDALATRESLVRCADGSQRLVEWHDTPLTDAVGAIIGAVSSGEDITELRRNQRERAALQAQLLQTQKMESIGSLAGGVAHDMNNVLGAILGIASVHVEGQPEGSTTRRAFATIIRASERGGKMVKGLLSFARMTASNTQAVDLNALLQEMIQLLERTTLAKVRLEVDLAADLRPIQGDPGALNHAFMNLCINAVDAMAGAGSLFIRTRNIELGQVEVQFRDTGVGMTPEVMERAMDPFFTTKPQGQGTGLGLAMVYSTIQAHGGTLELQSQPGAGTVVTTRFPAGPGEAPGDS